MALSDAEIRDEMITILLAGHETTATSMAWVMYRLLQHPEVLETTRTEVASVFGNGRQASLAEQVAELGYLDAVTKETARLHPVVPIVLRYLEAPTRIGDFDLPAGSVAVPCIYLTHRRPDVWPDPETFRPERFIDRRVDPYAFFPFGGGAHHCLGAAFATYEMKIVLARMLARVSLRPNPVHTVRTVRRGITFAPSGGLPVIRAADPCPTELRTELQRARRRPGRLRYQAVKGLVSFGARRIALSLFSSSLPLGRPDPCFFKMSL